MSHLLSFFFLFLLFSSNFFSVCPLPFSSFVRQAKIDTILTNIISKYKTQNCGSVNVLPVFFAELFIKRCREKD